MTRAGRKRRKGHSPGAGERGTRREREESSVTEAHGRGALPRKELVNTITC